MISDKSNKITDWYKEYYRRKGKDRNDLLRNREVMFQAFAADRAIINSIRYTKIDIQNSRILDVGCSSGESFELLLRLGNPIKRWFGIDIQKERLDKGVTRFPWATFMCSDASHMCFKDNSFDLVVESTMFIQIIDDNLRNKIAHEMLRVLKPGGYILLDDWRYADPRCKHYKALTQKRIKDLFCNNSLACVEKTFNGSLVPPVGRVLSSRLPSVYFLIHALLNFLVGRKVTLLRKK